MELDIQDGLDTAHPIPPLRGGDVERSSQDAAWRILQASDLIQRRMRAFEDRLAAPPAAALGMDTATLEALFERLDAAQAARFSALEDKLIAQQSDNAALHALADGVKASFDAVAIELSGLRNRMDDLAEHASAAAKPMDAAIQTEFETLANTLHDAVAACINERSALSDAAAMLNDGQLTKAFIAAAEQPLRSLSDDLRQIDQRLHAIESRPMPDAPLPVALQTRPIEVLSPAEQIKLWEPEKANLHRMLVAYNLMLKRMNEGVEAFEHQLGVIAGRPWPDSESMAKLFAAVEAVSAKIDPLPDAIASLQPKAVEAGVPPTLLAEKNALQQLVVGFRMIAADLAREADRFGSAKPAEVQRAPVLDTDMITGAIAEVIASAEMRFAEMASSSQGHQTELAGLMKQMLEKIVALGQLPTASAPAQPLRTSGDQDRLAEAVIRTESAARMMEQCRSAVADQIADLESKLKSGKPAEAKALKSELSDTTEAFERETSAFLALSAALSKELADARRARGEAAPVTEQRNMQKHRRIRA
jgi:hypothetical protein